MSDSAQLREKVLAWLKAGEDAYTAFRNEVPKPSDLAKDIAALANTGGGRILIGGPQRELEPNRFKEVNRAAVKTAVERALMLLPGDDLTVRLDSVPVHVDANTEVVQVEKSSEPVLLWGHYFLRNGPATLPANARNLLDLVGRGDPRDVILARVAQVGTAIEKQTTMLEHQRDEIARQSDMIAEQRRVIDRLEEGGTWKNKLLWASIGALLGLATSVPTFFLQ
jgi:hypothetical protein